MSEGFPHGMSNLRDLVWRGKASSPENKWKRANLFSLAREACYQLDNKAREVLANQSW